MAKRVRIVSIEEENITVMYGIQTLLIHDFNNPTKKPMRLFKQELSGIKTTNLGKLLRLAAKYNMKITSTRYRK